jgi:outer membrane protein OmpA-like peptidoglycan-associated protein
MKLNRCFFPGLLVMASTCLMAQNLISNPGFEEPPVVQVSKATKKSDTAQSSPHLPNSLDQVKITFPGWSVLMPRIKYEFNVPIFWDQYDFELIKKWYTEMIDTYNAHPCYQLNKENTHFRDGIIFNHMQHISDTAVKLYMNWDKDPSCPQTGTGFSVEASYKSPYGWRCLKATEAHRPNLFCNALTAPLKQGETYYIEFLYRVDWISDWLPDNVISTGRIGFRPGFANQFDANAIAKMQNGGSAPRPLEFLDVKSRKELGPWEVVYGPNSSRRTCSAIGWRKFSATFVADQPYTHLYVGNFAPFFFWDKTKDMLPGANVNYSMDQFRLIPLQELFSQQILDPGDKIELKNLLFVTGSHQIEPSSYPMLDQLANYLVRNPTVYLTIHGHTDNVGEVTANKNLSLARADAVRSYLISKGVDGARIKTLGHGSTIPKAPNNTEEGRRQNRRVEIEII